jgi:very-short-patch-repair endonuclease
MAAVLTCGPEAALSGREAGALWRLRPSDRSRIDVTAPVRLRRSRIDVHVRRLPADERTVRHGIPVTTAARTLFDLAVALQGEQLVAAISQAETLRLTGPLSLPQLMERYRGHRGTRALREALEELGLGGGVTDSELEDRFRRFLTERALPRPEHNAPLRIGRRWIEVDCLWRAQRVALELDGRAVHGTRAAFESDRLRDRELVVAGWTPVRVTWRQLEREAQRLGADLRALLTSARRATP